MSYKPENHNHVSPYIQAKNARSIINFLTTVFNGSELNIMTNQESRITHGEVRIKDSIIMLGEPARERTTGPIMIHIYVEDVDSTFQNAIDFGCKPIVEPDDTPVGERRAGVFGPEQNQWWFATRTN